MGIYFKLWIACFDLRQNIGIIVNKHVRISRVFFLITLAITKNQDWPAYWPFFCNLSPMKRAILTNYLEKGFKMTIKLGKYYILNPSVISTFILLLLVIQQANEFWLRGKKKPKSSSWGTFISLTHTRSPSHHTHSHNTHNHINLVLAVSDDTTKWSKPRVQMLKSRNPNFQFY